MGFEGVYFTRTCFPDENRIYGVDQDWTWGDIIHDLFSEFEEPILKSDTVEVSDFSSSLNVMPMEVIYPDLLEPVKIVHSFDKSLRFVVFKIKW